jgi:hypothetical protein
MAHITKIAAVETTTAIWEYDPSLTDNRVLNGSLDVIAAIRTLAIKVSCVSFRFISFRFFSLRFVSFRFVSLLFSFHSVPFRGSVPFRFIPFHSICSICFRYFIPSLRSSLLFYVSPFLMLIVNEHFPLDSVIGSAN